MTTDKKNKKHLVMARNAEIQEKGLETSKGHLDFNGQSSMLVEESIANEIESHQGLKGSHDVWTHEDPRYNWENRFGGGSGHRYFFGAPPSRRYRKNYRDIFGHD